MAITSEQKEQLLKGINPNRVAQRRGGGGKSLSYVEAWDIKAHLIRIFGFAEWSWDVTAADLILDENDGKNWNCGFRVLGTLRIHSTNATYSEAAVGFSSLSSHGESLDMACKTAESDALKRAAINLGDNFGLSLYKNCQTAPVVQSTLA